MKMELVMADPAGNRTALVLTQVPPQDRGPFAARLMELPELGAEQVGFVLPPPSGGLFRLEMMGGEFCGNAARSFGLYVARKLGRTGKLLVEVSGSDAPVPVEADPLGGTALVQVPGPWDLVSLPVPGMGELPAVRMPGIAHLLVPLEPGEEPPRSARVRELLELARGAFGGPAIGALFLDPLAPRLTPVVWVRGTDTTVWESSCASGTAAAALWLCRELETGERTFSFRQPGGVVLARVSKKGGKVDAVPIGGPVLLEPPVVVTL